MMADVFHPGSDIDIGLAVDTDTSVSMHPGSAIDIGLDIETRQTAMHPGSDLVFDVAIDFDGGKTFTSFEGETQLVLTTFGVISIFVVPVDPPESLGDVNVRAFSVDPEFAFTFDKFGRPV